MLSPWGSLTVRPVIREVALSSSLQRQGRKERLRGEGVMALGTRGDGRTDRELRAWLISPVPPGLFGDDGFSE